THADILQAHQAVLDARLGLDAVELEALREHVAEVQANALGKRLQAHERDQLADARLDLEELPVFGDQLQLAAERRIVDRRRIAAPGERALEVRLAVFDDVGKAHAREETAGVRRVELEDERAARALGSALP